MAQMVSRWLSLLCLAVLVAACGDGGATPPDAAEPVDASRPDAAPPMHRQYVIDRVTLPTDNSDVLRLDIDGNGTRENRLGSILLTAIQQGGGDENRFLVFLRQRDVTRTVDRGEVITLVDLASPSFREGEGVDVTVVDGAEPLPAPCDGEADPSCRRHLDGSGHFAARPGAVAGTASGAIIAGDLVAGPGRFVLRLPFVTGEVVDLPLAHARVELHDVATGVAGVLGGGVSLADVDRLLIPAIGAGYRADIDADCGDVGPGTDACGCTGGSSGRALRGVFDVDDDCDLTDVELRNSPFMRTLFGPDVDLEAPARQNDAVSFVVGVGAVPATWTAP
jgi:hypothetical protein